MEGEVGLVECGTPDSGHGYRVVSGGIAGTGKCRCAWGQDGCMVKTAGYASRGEPEPPAVIVEGETAPAVTVKSAI